MTPFVHDMRLRDMAPGDQPLLADNRPPSENSDRNAEEEDALLTGQHRPHSKRGWAFWREIGIFAWAVIATAAVVALAVAYQHQGDAPDIAARPSGKRNLIFMVSDGMGPTSMNLARTFKQTRDGTNIDDVLMLDKYQIGQSRTRSASSLITDSAAGATAFSCGLKSYNGAISVVPEEGHAPCGTVLEAAKKAGYMTGLVVTTRITDATPACFAAHANLRSEEDIIARQMVGEHPLGRVVDLILGGGRCHFLPKGSDGSCRDDTKDVIALAKDKGFTYIDDRQSFDALNHGNSAKLPLLGLFAPTDIPYEIDRRTQNDIYPALDEMAKTALNALTVATKDSAKGFFLMIEGSRIDHAGHGNDPAAQVHEVLAYDKAFAAVLEFLEKGSTDGVAVSTSDHETGGLAAAKQLHNAYPQYAWFPEVLANASHSGEYLSSQLHHWQHEGGHSKEEGRSYVKDLLKSGMGIQDASDAEVSPLAEGADGVSYHYAFADMISRRAQTGWSTHGHSGADVNIYASDPKQASALKANHENTEVGNFLRDYLDLDLEPITKELRERSESFAMLGENGEKISWTGRPADERGSGLDHYHGDYKKKRSLECGCSL